MSLTKQEKYKLQVQYNIDNHQHKISNSFCSLLPFDKRHSIESIKTFKSKSNSVQVWTNFDNPSKRRRKFYKLLDYPLSLRVNGGVKPVYSKVKVSECVGKATILYALEVLCTRVFLNECQTQDYKNKSTNIRPVKLNDLLFRDHLQALQLKACPLSKIIERLLFESTPLKRHGDFIHGEFRYRVKSEVLINRYYEMKRTGYEPLSQLYDKNHVCYWGMNEDTGELMQRPMKLVYKHQAPSTERLEMRADYWDNQF